MKIRTLTIRNFRCFGPEETTIELDDFGVLIGANGAGKTAILQALVRLFGASPSERRLNKADFHVPASVPAGALPADSLSLSIEVKLEFPRHHLGDTTGIPECFSRIAVDKPEGAPYCCIRLEGTWTKTLQLEGDITEKIFWSHLDDEGDSKLSSLDRSYIRVIYVPATRDPAAQLRQATGALLHPILGKVKWPTEVQEEARISAEHIRGGIRSTPGMRKLEEKITEDWKQLQDFLPLREVLLQPFHADFNSLVQRIDAFFQKCEGEEALSIDRLSDGLRSLFYFALLGARFEIEQDTINRLTTGSEIDYDYEITEFPLITFFAIEEPENHLAPHYLTHIVALLKRLAINDRNQVLLSSQSPAILGRIDPTAIRHVRLNAQNCEVTVRKLTLPAENTAEMLYIRGAVRAYPELYFAKAVVLGEGDSEAIVLPRIAAALGRPLDEQFISFVPLGGRFVSHFWRLLNDLEIPHFTLLDLDRERDGAYWHRIKYAVKELVKARARFGFKISDVGLTQEQYDGLSRRPITDNADDLLSDLEEHNVFFSDPLDLDFLMMTAYPEAYKVLEAGELGPRGVGTADAVRAATTAVLKEGAGQTYSLEDREDFVWYKYLFLGKRGKPATHLSALNRLSNEQLENGLPYVLERFVAKIAAKQDVSMPVITP